MQHININQITRRYALTPSQLPHKERLNHLTEQLVREYTEVAITACGFQDSDLVCIRELQLPIIFNPQKTDIEIFEQWLHAMQHAIATINHSDLIVFVSIEHAHLSIAHDLLRNNLQAIWAWHQVGLVSVASDSTSQVANDWLDRLLSKPQLLLTILPLLSESRRNHQGPIIQLLLRRMVSPERVLSLCVEYAQQQAGQAFWQGIADRVLQRLNSNTQPHMSQSLNQSNVSTNSGLSMVNQLSDTSSFQLCLTALFGPINSATLKRMSVDKLVQLVQVIVALIGAIESRYITIFRQLVWRKDSHEMEADLIQLLVNMSREVDINGPRESNQEPSMASNVKGLSPVHQQFLNDQPLNARDLLLTADSLKDSALHTNIGGLLLLLNLMLADEWQQRLIKLSKMAEHLEFVLLRLAQYMLNAPDDDPALLVFSGRLFHDENLSKGQSPHDQRLLFAAIERFAEELLAAMWEQVHPAEQDASSEHVRRWFTQFCSRRTRIQAQAGWVNVFYDLADVDTRIRAAGLDLDPGYIPWLGYVVKFYYE